MLLYSARPKQASQWFSNTSNRDTDFAPLFRCYWITVSRKTPANATWKRDFRFKWSTEQLQSSRSRDLFIWMLIACVCAEALQELRVSDSKNQQKQANRVTETNLMHRRCICQANWELLNGAAGTLWKMMESYSRHGQTACLLHLELNLHCDVNKSGYHKRP